MHQQRNFGTKAAKTLLLIVLAMAVLGLSGCGKQADQEKPQANQSPPATHPSNNEDPHWVYRDPNKPSKIAVVFVHGIFGSTDGTWTNANGTTFFQLLKADPDVGGLVDVYAFGFESKMFGGTGSLDVREGANKLKTYLFNDHVLDYSAVVFVGHSMGGLVILRYLASNLDKDSALAAKVPLVVLYGAPQEGAQIAAIAQLAVSNPGLAHMKPVDDNQWLQQLTDDWTTVQRKPQIVCGYEKAATNGILVVPWSSANRFCTEPGIAIDGADHISMVKPDRLAHPSVVMLTNALRRYVLPKQFDARLETPDFVQSGEEWHFLMDASMKAARIMNIGSADIKYWFDERSDPALYIVPDEGPATVAGNSSQTMRFLLLASAQAKRYSFRLRTDKADSRRVVVDVPDLERLRQQSAALAQNVIVDLNSHLAKLDGSPNAAAQMNPEVLASVAYKTVDKSLPDLPSSAKWVVAADVLSATSLNKLAAEALKKADSEAPEIGRSATVLDLERRVQSGTPGGTPILKTPVDKPTSEKDRLHLGPAERLGEKPVPDKFSPILSETSAPSQRTSLELAERMKRVPSLAGSGFTLEGAVKSAAGDKQAADIAFKKAMAIEPTPALQQRIAQPAHE